MEFLTSFVKFIVWLLVVSVEGKVTGRATCESTGLEEPARVTCHYRENVVEAHDVRAVSLLHDTGGKEERVVECLRFQNNGFDCIPKVGYKVNGTISDQMIINIPTARPEHQGTYYCELKIQQSEYQMESCNLKYKEPDDATSSTPPLEQDSDDQLKGDSGTSHVTAWLITITVILLLVIALLFCAVLFVFRRQRRRRKSKQQDPDAAKPEDKIDTLLPTSDTDDGNGGCKMDFSRFPYNQNENNILLPYDIVVTTLKPSNNGKIYSPAERKSRTKGNSQPGGYNTRTVSYHGSNTRLNLEKSRTDTHTHTRSHGAAEFDVVGRQTRQQ